MDGWSGENAKYARVRDGNLNKSFLNFVKVIFDRGKERKGIQIFLGRGVE